MLCVLTSWHRSQLTSLPVVVVVVGGGGVGVCVGLRFVQDRGEGLANDLLPPRLQTTPNRF